MPQVLVLGVVGLTVDLQGDVVCLGVVDLLVTALDVPLTPRSDDGHVRSQCLYGQLETNLVVALAGAAVADGIGAFFLAISATPLRCTDGQSGAQQVLFVLGTGLSRVGQT